MTESQILTYSERLKAFSNYSLVAAGAARVWVKGGVDFAALAWLAIAIGLPLLASGLPYSNRERGDALMPPLSNFAPAIIAVVMAGIVLLLTWHAWWQAHSGERKATKAAREAEA